MYDKLVAKVNAIPLNNIDTNDFVLKTKYNTDKIELKIKVPNIADFFKEAKLTELENKIPDICNLATKTLLTAEENKIPSVSNLFKKTDYNTKVTEIEKKLTYHNDDKYIDTQEFNKLTAEVFNSRIAQAKLITKPGFDLKLPSLNRKITANKSKHLFIENELNKLKTFHSNYFIGKSHFEEDGTQNYLVFPPIIRYFKVKTITNTDYVSSWKSKGSSAASIKAPTPELNYYGAKTGVKFRGSCLKQPNISYTHGTIVNIFIVYELGASSSQNNDPALKNCLFCAVTLTKNTDINKYKYSGYEIRFDRRSSFSISSGRFGQNVLIFGVDMSFSAQIDNKKKDNLLLRKGPAPGLEII